MFFGERLPRFTSNEQQRLANNNRQLAKSLIEDVGRVSIHGFVIPTLSLSKGRNLLLTAANLSKTSSNFINILIPLESTKVPHVDGDAIRGAISFAFQN
jgi:hypothetical protein